MLIEFNENCIKHDVIPVDRGNGWYQFFGEKSIATVRVYSDGSVYVHVGPKG